MENETKPTGPSLGDIMAPPDIDLGGADEDDDLLPREDDAVSEMLDSVVTNHYDDDLLPSDSDIEDPVLKNLKSMKPGTPTIQKSGSTVTPPDIDLKDYAPSKREINKERKRAHRKAAPTLDGPYIIKCLVSIFAVVITLGVIFWTLLKMNIIILPVSDIKDPDIVQIYETEDGTYTVREYAFIHKDVKDLIQHRTYVNLNDYEAIPMCLQDDVYFNVYVPKNKKYVYQFGKEVFNLDGSFDISVIGGVNMDTVGSLSGTTKNLESIGQYILATKDNSKGEQVVIRYFPDSKICLIAKCYDNEFYSSLYQSIVEGDPYTVNEKYSLRDVNTLSNLSYKGRYKPTTIINDVNAESTIKFFSDGMLLMTTRYFDIDTVADLFIQKIILESGNNDVKEMYITDSVRYYKIGQYYLGLSKFNDNTTSIMYGYGDEAKSNIIFNLIGQKGN